MELFRHNFLLRSRSVLILEKTCQQNDHFSNSNPILQTSAGFCYSVLWTWTAGTRTAGRPCMQQLTGDRRRCAACSPTTCATWEPSTTWWADDRNVALSLGIETCPRCLALQRTVNVLVGPDTSGCRRREPGGHAWGAAEETERRECFLTVASRRSAIR